MCVCVCKVYIQSVAYSIPVQYVQSYTMLCVQLNIQVYYKFMYMYTHACENGPNEYSNYLSKVSWDNWSFFCIVCQMSYL